MAAASTKRRSSGAFAFQATTAVLYRTRKKSMPSRRPAIGMPNAAPAASSTNFPCFTSNRWAGRSKEVLKSHQTDLSGMTVTLPTGCEASTWPEPPGKVFTSPPGMMSARPGPSDRRPSSMTMFRAQTSRASRSDRSAKLGCSKRCRPTTRAPSPPASGSSSFAMIDFRPRADLGVG